MGFRRRERSAEKGGMVPTFSWQPQPVHIPEEFHMRKILFGATALLLSLVALEAVSPEWAEAQEGGGGGRRRSRRS
jgi:hypothetical protein